MKHPQVTKAFSKEVRGEVKDALADEIRLLMLARHSHLEVDVMEVREIEILCSEQCQRMGGETLLAWSDRGDGSSNRCPLKRRDWKGLNTNAFIQLSILITHSPQINSYVPLFQHYIAGNFFL